MEFIGLKSAAYSWNPLKKFPRNAQCFCGGFQKAKNCCLPNLPLVALTHEVPALKLAIAKAEDGQRVAVKFTRIEDTAFKSFGHKPSVAEKIAPAVQSMVHANSGAEIIETKRRGFFQSLKEWIKGALKWVLVGQ